MSNSIIDRENVDRMRPWRWIVVILLASIEPLIHVWIAYCPPDGMAATGLRTRDGVIYVHAMRMFETDFASPFATHLAPHGDHDVGLYALPLHWVYGVVGVVQRALGLYEFIGLGLANGVAAFVYLVAVLAFLREVAPRLAERAFLLFALGGGLGGVAYLAALGLGVQDSPLFPRLFEKFMSYELLEGPGLLPILYLPRLYYSVSLAFCFGGLTAFARLVRTGDLRYGIVAAALLAIGGFVNIRFGVFAALVAIILLWSGNGISIRACVAPLVSVAIAVAVAVAANALVMGLRPSFVGNTMVLVRQAMWPMAFVTVAFFHLLLLPGEGRRAIDAMTRMQTVVAFAALGYLLAFVALYVGYQIYYGNFFVGGDSAAAQVVSDWSLIGVMIGAAYGWFRRRAESNVDYDHAWVLIWFLTFTAIAVSAFGQGWFLRLVPQRLIVFLGLPLAIMSASALDRFARAGARRIVVGFYVAFIFGGLCLIGVATACVQGPYASGYTSNSGNLFITRHDAALIQRIDGGIVLAPEPFSDIISLRRGVHVIGGVGSTDLSDQPYAVLAAAVNAFFSPKTGDKERRNIVETWRVTHVYCPDTQPVSAELKAQFEQTPWLKPVAREGDAVVYLIAEE